MEIHQTFRQFKNDELVNWKYIPHEVIYYVTNKYKHLKSLTLKFPPGFSFQINFRINTQKTVDIRKLFWRWIKFIYMKSTP